MSDAVDDYFQKQEARVAAAARPVTPEGQKAQKKQRSAKIEKMLAARKLKDQQREVIREKIRQGLPITQEERDILNAARRKKDAVDSLATLDKDAAKLVITPKSVNELRLLVETTAAKLHYNPVEALIKMCQETETLEDGTTRFVMGAKERAAVHKSLLPYLAPNLAAAKAPETADTGPKMKVVIKQFTIQGHKNADKPLFEQKPAVVAVETEQ